MNAPATTLGPRRVPSIAALAGPAAVDPYRLLFPLGVFYAIAGAGVWPWFALRGGAYPAEVHRVLMIEGFETCFVLGFLLTALPGFTRGERCRGWELAAAASLALAFGAAALTGRIAAAHAIFTGAALLLASAALRRVARAPVRPAVEFGFVGLGLALGIAGGIVQLGASVGWWAEPAPNFGSRLVSLGMVLGLVVGVGALLVPTFLGIKAPLVIPGIAGAHERRGRRALYIVLGSALAGSFALEGSGLAALGAWTRAVAVTTLMLWVWKIGRVPPRKDARGIALWSAGWLTLFGVALAALDPARSVAALHLTFIGGYGLLTIAIATRVVVAHGGHPPGEEGRVTPWPVVAAVLLALGPRLIAGWLPGAAPLLYTIAASLWIAAWVGWSSGALGRIAATRRPS